MTDTLPGIHHVTSIVGEPQQNVDFYTGVLGLRLVKVTVNFDMPQTYHFYYGDGAGSPGTILTVFTWPNMPQRPAGNGQITVTGFAIAPDSVDYWQERLAKRGVQTEEPTERFGETVIAFSDPDGLRYELVADPSAPLRTAVAWPAMPVPEEHALRGFSGITISAKSAAPTGAILTTLLGLKTVGREGNRARYQIGEGVDRAMVDIVENPDNPRGREGVGTVHHVAWRTPDDEAQAAWRERVGAAGIGVTPVRDRQYFRSIYFREPGGVLFEIATDPPGFQVDESFEELGSSLKLPPWLEPQRAEIEQVLPSFERRPVGATD